MGRRGNTTDDNLFKAFYILYNSATSAEVKEAHETLLQQRVDGPLLTMGLILAPLIMAEAAWKMRDLKRAVAFCDLVLEEQLNALAAAQLRAHNELIEFPFASMLKAQILLEQGDFDYKSRLASDDPAAAPYGGMAAALSYLEVQTTLGVLGDYVQRIQDAAERHRQFIEDFFAQHTLTELRFNSAPEGTVAPLWSSEQRAGMEAMVNGIPIDTFTPITGYSSSTGLSPYEYYLEYEEPPPDETIMLGTNPHIFALVCAAEGRLQQLQAGYNFLGYRDDYVPPWRFDYLLSRARYFAEHARSAQAEYINFVANAEREEFQEQSARQAVELEKANLDVESARVELANQELLAAQEAKELAELAKDNAASRSQSYQELSDTSLVVDVLAGAAAVTNFAGSVVLAFFGQASESANIWGLASNLGGLYLQHEQREYEQQNLDMALEEAEKSAEVAQCQENVAVAGVTVATLQKAAAALRHDHALTNLDYLQNRVLNAEMWSRLAELIRVVRDRYMGQAIELSFLTEQAYEFESDRRVNVIRFDYDRSEESAMLAADFLLADLDTLESNYILTQQTRQQHVRYVLSLATECPAALEELRLSGSSIFYVTLAQLERRFPGLYNIRIGSVDVLPVALMDPTRFSLELTHLGVSMVRVRGRGQEMSDPTANPPKVTPYVQSWMTTYTPTVDLAFPVLVRPTGPETNLYSGLSRAERDAVFPLAAGSQLNAFQHRGAASAWHLNLDLKENRIDPRTLADVLITFNLSGYFDPILRAEIERTERPIEVLTSRLSGARHFADSFYAFQQDGRMTWKVKADQLTVDRTPGRLRNVGVIGAPAAGRPDFTGLFATRRVELDLLPDGSLVVLSEVPQLTLAYATNDPMTVEASVTLPLPQDATVSWFFGDGSEAVSGTPVSHTYNRPGRYEITLRVVRGRRLSEQTAVVHVSTTHAASLEMPLTAYPALSVGTGAPEGLIRLNAAIGDPASFTGLEAVWVLNDKVVRRADSTSFDLRPGRYRLSFTAIRPLTAHVYSTQCYNPGPSVTLEALCAVTNRRYSATGQLQEPPPEPNELTTHLFLAGVEVSPVDTWTLELPGGESVNRFLNSVDAHDELSVDLRDLGDLALVLEYEAS